jgi:hypothetical protein
MLRLSYVRPRSPIFTTILQSERVRLVDSRPTHSSSEAGDGVEVWGEKPKQESGTRESGSVAIECCLGKDPGDVDCS